MVVGRRADVPGSRLGSFMWVTPRRHNRAHGVVVAAGRGGGTNQVSAPAPRAQLVDSSAVVCRQGRRPDAPYPALAYTSAATPLCLHITRLSRLDDLE